MTFNHGTMLTLNSKTNAEVDGGSDYAAHKSKQGVSLPLHLALKVLEPLKQRYCFLGHLFNYFLSLTS